MMKTGAALQETAGQALPTAGPTVQIPTNRAAIIAISKQFLYVVTIYVI
jgi:hypothetical protein